MRNNRTEEKAGKDAQGERESDGKVEDGRRGKGGTIWEKVRGRIGMEKGNGEGKGWMGKKRKGVETERKERGGREAV